MNIRTVFLVLSTASILVTSTDGSAEKIKWVGQAHVSPALYVYKPFKHVAERITAASGGRLELTPYPAGAIVPPTKEFDGVDKGIIDFALGGYTFWLDKWPAAGLFSQVCGNISPMQHYMWYTSGGGIELAQKMMTVGKDYNVMLIPGGGLLQMAEPFLHTRKPIRTLSDLRELKIRAVGDGGTILSRMGVSVVFMGGGQIYEAMSRNVIDGFELGTIADTYDAKLHEVIKYIYISPVRSPHEIIPIYYNRNKYQALPDDLKIIVETITREEALRVYSSLLRSQAETLEAVEKTGVKIEKLPEEIEAAFLAEAEKYYNELAGKNVLAKEILDSQNQALSDFKQLQPGGL